MTAYYHGVLALLCGSVGLTLTTYAVRNADKLTRHFTPNRKKIDVDCPTKQKRCFGMCDIKDAYDFYIYWNRWNSHLLNRYSEDVAVSLGACVNDAEDNVFRDHLLSIWRTFGHSVEFVSAKTEPLRKYESDLVELEKIHLAWVQAGAEHIFLRVKDQVPGFPLHPLPVEELKRALDIAKHLA